MDFVLTGSIFVALVAYRVAAPILDRIANYIWSCPRPIAGRSASGHIRGATQGASKAAD